MRFLRNLPIKRKLIIITMVTTALALATAAAAFTIVDRFMLRRYLAADLAATADMVGFNSASALAFNDPGSATQTLHSLVAQPQVQAARVYGRDGEPFASYHRNGMQDQELPPRAIADGSKLGDGFMTLSRAIVSDGEVIGTILLRSDLSKVNNRLGFSVLVFGLVTLGAGIVAYGVVARLQRVISAPVSHLAAVAGRVAAENNYALRATKQGKDEVGALIDGFNEMLAGIQARDAALQRAHDELETRVRERTQELASSVSLLNATLDSTTDGIIAVSHSRELVCCNSKFTAMWGIPADMMARNNADEIIAFAASKTRMPAWFVARIRETATRLDPCTVDTIELLDGRTFERYVQPQRIDGREIGIVVSYRNVTERKQAEEQVALERARLKFIFESVPVGISLLVPGQEETHVVNPAHTRITGIAPEELHLPGAFDRATHPDDLAQQRDLVRRYKAGEIDHFSIEKRYVHRDGRVVWASLTRRMFTDPVTRQKQSITAVIDITDLKAAQELTARQQARFKFIFETVPVGLAWTLNGQLPTRIVNPAHTRITGVPVEHCQDLEKYVLATHEADRARQAELRRQLDCGAIDHYEIEKRYLHPDGSIRWAAMSVRGFRDPESGEKQEITTLVDITERREAEAKLADTHRQLLVTSRQAGMAEIATGVLHNVGNVLNSVNVSTTMLADLARQSRVTHVGKLADLIGSVTDIPAFFASDPRGRKVPGFLRSLSDQLAREQGEQLKELESLRKSVEHIKDIVAMQQNYAKVSGVSETLVVTELIEDAVRMNATALSRHDVTLVRDFQVQPKVTVDKHKVLQIMINLMRNAKYACDDSGRPDKQMIIRVTAARGRVSIAVEDNGVGIPPENLTKIFAHGFTTRKHGHGFGLHSGALAARELGGSLIARSEGPGKGATFILELPEHFTAAAAA